MESLNSKLKPVLNWSYIILNLDRGNGCEDMVYQDLARPWMEGFKISRLEMTSVLGGGNTSLS
ncbi:hypothetical protein AMD27_01345 [Acinetobacter sp. TGL-Y2]|nr:hypothetical protein AMD27_01345 [Acinetobacter sp. TGL-Y2]